MAPVVEEGSRITTGDLVSTKVADFAATLREALGDDVRLKRFARLNIAVRAEKSAYVDDTGCRSWWV